MTMKLAPEVRTKVEQIKGKMQEIGFTYTDDEALSCIRKNKLRTTITKLLDEGHLRAEIDKTVKQIIVERQEIARLKAVETQKEALT